MHILPTRASVMLDVVFLAMFAVVPLLGWSIHSVRHRRNYALHKRVQLTLGAVLLVAVTCFELDMQLFTDWRARAANALHDPGPRFVHLAVAPARDDYLRFPTPPIGEQLAELRRALSAASV